MAEYTLNTKITKLIDDLVNEELFASYHYKSAFAWCALKNYNGGKAFFDKESQDEQVHATGLIDYAADWGHLVRFSDIAMPDTFKSLVDIIERSLSTEYALCEKYKEAYKTAIDIQANTAIALFAKYVKIQDKAVREYLTLLEQANGYAAGGEMGLRLFDKNVLSV
jgi:ferritin